jgi:uncharacterized protein (TIGR02646 family)
MESQARGGVKYVPAGFDIPPLLQSCKTRQPMPDNPAGAWQTFTRRTANRRQLKTALHARQNGLCVYCEIALESSDNQNIGSHVDHILPKEKHPTLTFDYDNLVLSCFATGGEIRADEKDPAPVSCGHAKLKRTNNFDELLFIKPTDSNCEHYFSFELDGGAISHPSLSSPDVDKAEHTLEVLNLNCLRLKRLREEMITQLYQIIGELQHDTEALKQFLMLELQETKSFINARKQQIG